MKRISAISFILLLLVLTMSCSKTEQTEPNGAEKEAQMLSDSLRSNSKALSRWMRSYERQNEPKAALIMRQMYGKALRDESLFEEAIAQHDTCINIAKELNDTMQQIIAMNNQGTNFRRMGDLQSAADMHYAALELSDAMNDQQSEMAIKNEVRALNGLGNVLLSLKNLEAAEEVFRRALDGETKLGSETGQAINLANLGSIKEQTGHLDSAHIYYNRSMELNRKVNNPVGIALCYHYLGHLAEKEGMPEEALRNFRMAYDTSKPTGDVWHWLEACNALADALLNNNQLDSARQYVDLSMESALSIHSQEHLAEAFALRSKLEEKSGNSNAALRDLHESLILKDSIESETNENHMTNLRVNYESNMRIKEVSKAETEAQYEKTTRVILTWSIIIIFILVVLTLVMRIRAAKTRKRAAIALQMANENLLRANQERQTFYRNITHQLRTPLTVVIGMVNQLQNHIAPDDDEGQEELAATQRQSRELLELVSRMIKVSKEGTNLELSDINTAYSTNSPQKTSNKTSIDPTNKAEKKGNTNTVEGAEGMQTAEDVSKTLIHTSAKPMQGHVGKSSVTNGAKVLIAEDNEDVARLIQNIFQNNGYITTIAHDGQEALDFLVANELPDIVISDIAMPRMDGLELIRQIRADDTMNHLPIVVVSARVEDSERLEGLDAGAEVYLAKPFIVDELLLRAQKLLEQRAVLRRRFSNQQESDLLMQNLANEEKAFFTLLNDIIQENIAEPELTSNMLADKLCMSRSQLNRKVKNLTGDDTSHYIRNRRLMHACHLLATTKMPIGHIETECGFDTPGYFSRTFKSVYNATPSEYRKKAQKA